MAALGLALLVCTLAGAPAARAESLLELLPPGEPLLPMDAHVIALGGAAEARWELESGLPSNPAQLMAIEGVSFATVLQLRRGLRDLEGAGPDWDETRQDFPAFQISATLPRGLHLGIGYRADLRSRAAYSLVVPFVLDDAIPQHYALHYTQSGGLSRFPFSLAMQMGENYRAGIGLNLYRGNLSQEWIYDFPNALSGDADLGYQDRRVRRQASWYGTGFVLGLQARPLPATVFSLRWEGGSDLSGDSQIETAGEVDRELETLSGRMPARWALGAARSLPRGTIVSLQYEHEAWASYEAPLSGSRLADVNRLCLGVEWLGEAAARGARSARRLPLRLGLRLGNWPAPDPLTGSEVREMTFSLGTGVDLPAGRGSLDFAFYWQQLGMDEGESERRLGLALSLRTSETWTRRTQPY